MTLKTIRLEPARNQDFPEGEHVIVTLHDGQMKTFRVARVR